MAINISMMAREPEVMITYPSSKEKFSRALSWYARSAKEKEPGLKESQYRKDDSHRRPMSDTHDECQTLPQGRLPGKVAPRKSFEVCTVQANGSGKNKQYGSQVKCCRDPLEPCKPPWISTTKKAHSVWQNTAYRASRSKQSLKFRIIRLVGMPQSASSKVIRSAQLFDRRDQSEAKHGLSPPGWHHLTVESRHD
jgi:hypothetical protein